jgi:hypothetical protein
MTCKKCRVTDIKRSAQSNIARLVFDSEKAPREEGGF